MTRLTRLLTATKNYASCLVNEARYFLNLIDNLIVGHHNL